MAETDTLVVGAGPQALTVVARWVEECPECLGDMAVVDRTGRWLGAWDQALAHQSVDVLRSPGVHHPAPEPMAFIWANAHGVGTSAAAMTGPLKRPSTAAFRSFCGELIEQLGLEQIVQGRRVVNVTRDSGHWIAQLDNGETMRARRVVWAGNTRVPRLPDNVEPCPSVAHAQHTDLSTLRPGECVAVIGGGQTAGQLALEACRCGASVALVSRAPCRIADFDIDAGWLMEDHLGPFRSQTDPVDRFRTLEEVRIGSMTAELDDALQATDICRLHGVGEIRIHSGDSGAVVIVPGLELAVDRVILATGWQADVRADPALRALADGGAPHVNGLPVLDQQLQWVDDFHVVGALAALTIGPAAGNLGGARAAADLLADHAPSRRPVVRSLRTW